MISSSPLSTGVLGLAAARDPETWLEPLKELAGARPELTLASARRYTVDGQLPELPGIPIHRAEAGHDLTRFDRCEAIDGVPPREGLICDCCQGVRWAPPRHAPQPYHLIFETSGSAPFELPVDSSVAALTSIILTFSGFLAHDPDL